MHTEVPKASDTEKPSRNPITVLDSSAIASIFFEDKFTESMERTIRGSRETTFSTLDIAYAEVGSVAWKGVTLFKQPLDLCSRALEQAMSFISDNCNVVPCKELIEGSFQMGIKHGIQIYDALFLTLAQKHGAHLLTADERLDKKVSGIKELQGITKLPRV
ncbi:MAG: type II toxin-antitoxin system VapC family toxin [Nitrososphaerales archaeon]